MTPSRTATPAPEESDVAGQDVETEETSQAQPGSPEAEATAQEAGTKPEAEPPAEAEGDTATPSDGGAEGGEAASPPDSQAPEAQPAAEDPEQVETQPFSFRIAGERIEVPDAVETPYGIVMSREAFQRFVQPRLADPEAMHKTLTGYREKIRELEGAQNEKIIRADALAQEIDRLLEDPNALVEFVNDFERSRDALGLRVENRILKAQREAPTTPTADGIDSEWEVQALANQLPGWLDQGIAELQKEPDIKALGLTDAQLFTMFWPLRGTLFLEPQPGRYEVNLQGMRAHLAPMAARVKAMSTGAQQQVAAAKHNARAVGKPANAPPPVAGAKGSPAAGKGPVKYKTRREYEDAMARLARGQDDDED